MTDTAIEGYKLILTTSCLKRTQSSMLRTQEFLHFIPIGMQQWWLPIEPVRLCPTRMRNHQITTANENSYKENRHVVANSKGRLSADIATVLLNAGTNCFAEEMESSAAFSSGLHSNDTLSPTMLSFGELEYLERHCQSPLQRHMYHIISQTSN